MRSFLRALFIITTAFAVAWITMPDLVCRLVHPLPQCTMRLAITRTTQEFHFHHEATGIEWIVWIALVLIGWRVKGWGKKQLSVAIPLGVPGGLPLWPILKQGGLSIWTIAHGWSWLHAGLIMLVLIILISKCLIWRYWYYLAFKGSKKPLLRT